VAERVDVHFVGRYTEPLIDEISRYPRSRTSRDRRPLARSRFRQVSATPAIFPRAVLATLICSVCAWSVAPQSRQTSQAQGNTSKLTWHTVEFAIVKLNDAPPISWNIYHSQKKGVLLVRLWKRYLLIRVSDEEVYDIDPQKIKVDGDAVEWSTADIPDKPIDTPDWKERNLGPLDQIRFRFGKDGHMLELQMPYGPDGRPLY
jgi:hypothetical protein